jgi:hypothetical protein
LTWLFLGYLALYAWLVLDGVRDDVRKAHPKWYVAAGVIAAVSIITLLIAYKYSPLAALLGKGSAALLLVAAGWELLSGYADLRTEPRPAGMSPRVFLWVKLAGVLGVIVYSLPAYWMALAVVRRAWSTGAA